jgi:hypothetical protein
MTKPCEKCHDGWTYSKTDSHGWNYSDYAWTDSWKNGSEFGVSLSPAEYLKKQKPAPRKIRKKKKPVKVRKLSRYDIINL